MSDEGLRALNALRFNWAPVSDDLWRPLPYHVEELHRDVVTLVLQSLETARTGGDASPIGVVIEGQRGAGKTHLLGWLREKAQKQGGYFFLVELLNDDFADSVVRSITEGLRREDDSGVSQLRTFLRRLASDVTISRNVRRAVSGETVLTRAALDSFVDAVRQRDRSVGRECQDVLRALALQAADDPRAQDAGDAFFDSLDDEAWTAWGIRRVNRSPQLVVRDVSRLLALTGPAVIAVDQIDTLIAQSRRRSELAVEDDPAVKSVIANVANGLMELRQITRRTVTVLACLPASWAAIKATATDTVRDRFRQAVHLNLIPTPDVGRRLIELRLAGHYATEGFTPPYASWPVRPEAFTEAVDFTPRQLLQTVESHIQACVAARAVRELDRLTADGPGDERPQPPVDPDSLRRLDRRFTELRSTVDVSGALDQRREDELMPDLLAAGLTAWIMQQGAAGRAFTIDPRPGPKPPLHARLRRTLDEETDDEIHWAFRGIAAENALAALSRVRKARAAAGLARGVPKRKLFLVRRWQWSRGAKTTAELESFVDAGGRYLDVSDDDLRTLASLHALMGENHPDLPAWFAARRPADELRVLSETLGDAPPANQADPEPADRADPEPADRADPEPAHRDGAADAPTAHEPTAPGLPIGTVMETGQPMRIELEALRKHAAIFAGSGSGKTVLIRRLVEECALHGVSSIVLDPNNDLSRLGEPWPEPPTAWSDGDPAKAAAYLAGTDVVVWTPRRAAGRPLSFQPLPDFREVRDDADELGAAIDAAVAALAPRANVDGTTTKASLGRAVLRETLQEFARRGGSRLRDFLALLADLPEGVSELDRADRIAADLAQALTAATVNDPLFGGSGQALDPGVLLTPPSGKRARVSVISFVGLPSDDQRQSFVNQLQMALFAWIKKNPAGDRPLGGLLVMDEAQTLAPSGAMTACTQSTIALASQARKYGLGLVFATQAPKGLHNRIPGNAATQFFGFLNSPIQIAAAREMAQAKGGDVPDISRLRTGQFYLAAEGMSLTKTQTPLCLSYHPKSPPTAEEVIRKAREGLS